MPKSFSVYEPNSVDDYLEENDAKIEVGDFISYEPYNQMGMIRYEVILDGNGKKSLKKIDDYDSMMRNEEEQNGGKKRRRRKTRRNKKTKRNKKSRSRKSKKNRKR